MGDVLYNTEYAQVKMMSEMNLSIKSTAHLQGYVGETRKRETENSVPLCHHLHLLEAELVLRYLQSNEESLCKVADE